MWEMQESWFAFISIVLGEWKFDSPMFLGDVYEILDVDVNFVRKLDYFSR